MAFNNISGINRAPNRAGLRKKPTFNELVNYVEKDPDKIKYPDRFAKEAIHGFQFSQFLGEGFREMEIQNYN